MWGKVTTLGTSVVCRLPASCTTCSRCRDACSLWEGPVCGALFVVRLQCILCDVSSFPNRRYFTGAPLASFSLLPHPARPVLAPASANTPPVPTGRLARKRRQNPQLDLGVRVSWSWDSALPAAVMFFPCVMLVLREWERRRLAWC